MARFRRSGKNWEGRKWSVAAPIDSLADAIEGAYPPSHPKDGTVASKAHDRNSPNSDHRPKPTSGTGVVRALDFGEHNEEGFGIMDAIRASHDPRLKYGIHEGQMFSSYASRGIPPFTWRPYGGSNQHLDHGHISTLTSADGQGGPWDIGTGTGDDDMSMILDALKAQDMAYYEALQTKTGSPGGNAKYWGHDYPGTPKPSNAEWRDAADELFAASLEAGVMSGGGSAAHDHPIPGSKTGVAG